MKRISVFVFAAVFVGVLLAPSALGQGRRGPRGRPAPPPERIFERLNRMSPEQRERMLRNLPPERRKIVEERLREYNGLSPEQRKRLRRRFEQFQTMPEEKQEAARKIFGGFRELPPDRRRLLQEEFRNLRRMDEAGRRARIESEEFQNKFTPVERQLVEEFSVTVLAPDRDPG
jgi:hypothetical protein